MPYHYSSSSSSSSSSPSSSSSAMPRANAQGQVAPAGYHYMPDGSLMSDAEHERLHSIESSHLKIQSFVIDENSISASPAETRNFTIKGDPGAVFSLEVTNEDSPSKYYDFGTESFTTTKKRLENVTIPSNGVYTNYIKFPAVSDDDHYNLDLWAEAHFKTKHVYSEEVDSMGLITRKGSNSNLLRKTLYQYVDINTVIIPDPKTTDSNYKAMPTNITISAPRYSNESQNYTADINWVFESNPTGTDTFALFIVRQPLETDFEVRVDTAVDVSGGISGLTSIVLDSVDNIAPDMYMTGNGVTSTPPTVLTVDADTKTITVSSAQTLPDDRGLTFWGEGSDAINTYNDTKITFSDLSIELEPLTVTVNGATSTSRNITLSDAGGIRVGTDATIEGIGFDNATTQRPTAINYSTKVLQVTSNQSLEDGTILKVDGYGKKATMTGTITMSRVPNANFNIYFDVEAVVTALTS